MMNTWNKLKRSGSYYRNLKRNREKFIKRVDAIRSDLDASAVVRREIPVSSTSVVNRKQQQIFIRNEDFNSQLMLANNHFYMGNVSAATADVDDMSSGSEQCNQEITVDDDGDSSGDNDDEITRNHNLRIRLRKWAVDYNISHMALKELISIINDGLGKDDGTKILPSDPRTLMQTPQSISVVPLIDGEYWHHGVSNCLKKIFTNLNKPITISLTINLDGLPVFNSSKVEFWPILFCIAEMPQVPAMVIGIFSGKTKTSDIDSFLSPFVDEMKQIMDSGVEINSHKITVKLRCFVCDSPARAFVKGVANFNGQHGCLKCTTIGEYSYVSSTNIFPRTECERRTDEIFRKKRYGGHHKMDSPLLKLKVDMIEQFPVGDSLHLLHLGVMKRLLFGWRDGTFRNSGTKWRAKTTFDVSEYLMDCKMPSEFHRVVRSLDCLSHWKGTEYRTFLHYIGIVVLKDHLELATYEHFLLFFCAVTICSSKKYFHLLPLARELLLQYIEVFKEIYGEQYLTSNFHNLSHLVDDVERFGELETFSAYPFENMLGKIKRLIRSGNRPLAQVAKRIVEGFSYIFPATPLAAGTKRQNPKLSKRNNGENVPDDLKSSNEHVMAFYSKVELEAYCLSTDSANCWIQTSQDEIACVMNIVNQSKNNIKLCCAVTDEKDDFFTIPIKSSVLDIYCTSCDAHVNSVKKLLDFSDIKCKLVRLKYHNTNVFLPLLHTNGENT